MTKLNKALMASTAIAFACGLALPASAQDPAAAPGVVSSGSKMKIKLYGQVAKVFGIVDDGDATTFKVGENGNTATRMGLDSRGKINSDVSVRTRFEFAVQSGDNGGGSQFVNQGGSASRFTVRHLDLIVTSKKFGAVWIGRGDTASNGTAEQQTVGGIDSGRLGGTTALLISNYRVLSSNSSSASRDLGSVGSWFDWMDGANRMNRIRYDTPSFFGFKGGASFMDKNNFDLALHYAGKVAGTKVKGAVGFCHTVGAQTSGSGTCFGNSSGTIRAITQIDGSVSVLTPIGLSASFSGGTKWRDLQGSTVHSTTNNSAWNITPSVAYTTKVNSLGATILDFAFEYCKYCNTSYKNSDGKAYSLMLMQRVDSVGGDYFVTFRYFDVSTGDTGTGTDGLWFFGGGFRQRF
jgi:hypothetical protein